MPDWAPFAQIDDAEWRELQRRRSLIRLVSALGDMARDEGLTLSAQVLNETVARLQSLLMQPASGPDDTEGNTPTSTATTCAPRSPASGRAVRGISRAGTPRTAERGHLATVDLVSA